MFTQAAVHRQICHQEISNASACRVLSAYHPSVPRLTLPGARGNATWAAGRCGVEAEVILSLELCAEMAAYDLHMEDLLAALREAMASGDYCGHTMHLRSDPTTEAACVDEYEGRPVIAIRLR